jgi:hypothetical protein
MNLMDANKWMKFVSISVHSRLENSAEGRIGTVAATENNADAPFVIRRLAPLLLGYQD